MKNGFTDSSKRLWCVTASYYLSLKANGADVESDIAKYFINNRDKGYLTNSGWVLQRGNLVSSYSIDGRQAILDEVTNVNQEIMNQSKDKDKFNLLNDYLITNKPKAVMLRMSENDSLKYGHTISIIRDGKSYRVFDTSGFGSPKGVFANNTIYNPKDDFSKSALYNVYNVKAPEYAWQFSSFIVVR